MLQNSDSWVDPSRMTIILSGRPAMGNGGEHSLYPTLPDSTPRLFLHLGQETSIQLPSAFLVIEVGGQWATLGARCLKVVLSRL